MTNSAEIGARALLTYGSPLACSSCPLPTPISQLSAPLALGWGDQIPEGCAQRQRCLRAPGTAPLGRPVGETLFACACACVRRYRFPLVSGPLGAGGPDEPDACTYWSTPVLARLGPRLCLRRRRPPFAEFVATSGDVAAGQFQ